jgi:hypothetical protein
MLLGSRLNRWKWSINILITLFGVLVYLTGKRDYLAMIYPLRALKLCRIAVLKKSVFGNSGF